ncbi:MAG TPA: flagellar protein FlaG [Bryobacteraceae bacterium]|jgi:flagellar protein FlaG|nr:flagellar protein FlaG [Bryobacteraceae bacterium]
MASAISVPAGNNRPVAADLPAVSADDRAFNLSVATAVRQLNESGYAGDGHEVTLSIDPDSRQPVVKVIDSDTKDVITQLPSRYALALAADFEKKKRDS